MPAFLAACPQASSPESETDSGRDTGGDSAPCTDASWFRDADGDGLGDGATSVVACEAPEGFVAQAGDCDDSHPTAGDGADERQADGVDNDCDGVGATGNAGRLSPWRVAGEPGGDTYVGRSIALGDADGDGFGDLFVTMPGNFSEDPQQEGLAMVFGGPLVASDTVATRAEATAVLVAAPWNRASEVCVVGDTDGDASIEFLVGAPNAVEYDEGGVAYLASGPFSGTRQIASESRTFYGEAFGHRLGYCAGPGDIDGDGLADLVLAAPADWAEDPAHGRVYVLLGPLEHAAVTEADMILEGQRDREHLGLALTGAGDVDGDGRGDFVASDGYEGGVGALVVTEFIEGRPSADEAAARVLYTAGDDGILDMVRPGMLGDTNGDGYADVGFGEVASTGTAGHSYWVLHGPIVAGERRILTEDSALVLYTSNRGSGSALEAGVALGDFNDDGVVGDDIALGDHEFMTSLIPDDDLDCFSVERRCLPGAVFLIAAPLAPGTYELDASFDRIEGVDKHSQFGEVLAAGDVDNDALADLIVAAPNHDWAGEGYRGMVYTFPGGRPTLHEARDRE
ncbi:MAG: FG-GAP repeat protein [Deltaproteobacteria bacterium]|nr:FG-GAP repeat protein [Deltaproteobacteria bacterium]